MPAPIQPGNEAQRLAALGRYQILDTTADQSFDDLTLLAAHICGFPMSMITLVDERRQWLKSKVGIPFTESPRDTSFCGHGILQSDLLVVPDATKDERFRNSPLVTGDLHVRSYVGAPLITSDGYALGMLCVMDRDPRELSENQKEALRVLSRQVMFQLELLKQTRELAESDARLRIVTEYARVGLVIVNEAHRYIYANRTYAEILELPSSDIVGKSVADILPGAYEQHIRPRLEQAFAGAQVSYELQQQGRHGDHFYAVRYQPFKSERGDSLVVVVITDITELKQGERGSARLAAIVDSSDDAIIGKDLNSVIRTWNRGAEKIFGYSSAEMIGTSIMRLIPPDRQDEEQHILDTIRRGESVEHFETLRQTKGGRLISVSVTASPIRDVTGNIVGVSKVARDITQKRRADAALRSSEERYRTLFEYAPDGILIITPQGRNLDGNAAICRMLGYARDELVGLQSKDIVTQSEFEHIATAIESIKKGEPYHREWLFCRKDGSQFSADMIANAMPDGNFLAIIRDITERKKLEQQLMRAQRMESIGTLAGGIAHDLNNILSPILMSVEVLRSFITDLRGLAFLDTLHGSAMRGTALVKQVLSFARGMQGERIRVNPAHLMRELMTVIRDTFPKSIDARFSAPNDLWTVIGDPTQMHQVFLNLCVNARDAMPAGGSLTVKMENAVLDETYTAMNIEAKPGAYVKVTVADTGIGIPAEFRERIFEPFFTTKEFGKGTGLGLSTTLAIVKSHQGFINVYSEVGKGTKFKIYFPADTTAAAAESVAVEQTGLPRGNNELVLVVDDEEALRLIVKGALERFGYRVLLAKNGAEAVALYAQHKSDIAVVLTDMAMPVLDGPATIVALKSINPDVKIIGTSGLAANGDVAKAVGAGVHHFVPKPYTAETMLRVLKQALDPANTLGK